MKTRLRISLFACFFFLALLASALPYQAAVSSAGSQDLQAARQWISPGEIRDLVAALSSPQFGGRLTGSPPFRAMAEHLAGRFREWGVGPGADNGYLQSWPVVYTVLGKRSRLALVADGRASDYEIYREYMPALFTATARVEASAVFVGYGITASELGYDDYEGVDVRGRLALVIKGMPTQDVQRWSRYDDHAVRMKNARDHGAAGAIYIYLPVAVPKGIWQKDFPVALVSRKVAEDFFAGIGQDYGSILRRIAETGKPHSFDTGRSFRIETESTHHPQAEGLNLVGWIEGADPALRNEAVVIGAHMDGLGDSPELFPGAYDNASGTATMMQVAKAFARSGQRAARSLCFVGFGGEEMGKLGSEYFARHPPGRLTRIVAMINLDMTGVGDAMRVAGGERYPELARHFIDAAHLLGQDLLSGELTIPPNSDYGPFMERGVPVIGVTSAGGGERGGPMRPHTPRDTPDQINPAIAASIAQLVYLASVSIAKQP